MIILFMAKLTNNEFIERSKKTHGNKYDYSLVNYVNSNTKVKIICPKHGIFEQNPYKHQKKCGCPKCVGKNKTTEECINNAKKIHGNKYDYSLVEYKNGKSNMKFICPKHGMFEQRMDHHLEGYGCSKCYYESTALDNDTFTIKANQIYNNKYDYSLVHYINNRTKVKIICPIHGIFEQKPNNHLNGHECNKCSDIWKTTDQFINDAKNIHNDKYDYSLVIYVNCLSKIKIICSEHGIFEQSPNTHLSNHGCPKCADIMRSNLLKKTTNQFIISAKIIHGNKYDYSLAKYEVCKMKIKIICPIHELFEQKPNDHLSGRGCPRCKKSKGEIKIERFLIDNNIAFICQKTFNNCKNKNKLIFDFYLPEYNLCIEYDGKQHFELVEYFGGKNGFKLRQINDKIKNDFCLNNNINLLRIKYNENIENKLKYLIEKIF